MKIIDISENNGNIDFSKMKQENVQGIIIRVGWIGNKENHTLDKKFINNLTECKKYGIAYGLYVYSYCKNDVAMLSGSKWTENIIKVYNCKPTLPVFIDMEDNSTIACGKNSLTQQAITFCNYIKVKTGFNVGVYANLNWYRNYLDINKLQGYKIWLAEYNNKQKHSANFSVDLWQYSSKGCVTGINGFVDLNRCYSCYKENKEGDFDMKIYKNGSTKEIVYLDSNCTKEIGYLNPRETGECYGRVGNVAIVCYNIDNSNNKKVGFVKWLGGIIN